MSSAANHWATFYLGNEHFALPVEEVQEVLIAQPLTPVPLAPPQVLGLLNLRGTIVPAIDLRTRLGAPPLEGKVEPKLLVLKGHEGPISILVDEIGDVFELDPSAWRPVPQTVEASRGRFLFGIAPRHDGLLLGVKAASLAEEPT